jgi:hypothetical protein
MALTEVNSSAAIFDPARAAKMFHDSRPPAAALGLSFAVAPKLARTIVLRDPGGGAAIVAPASLATVGAGLSMLRYAIFRNVLPRAVLR